MPGHNNSLSVALTHSGLSTPRNTKFTQAQNAALLQSAQPNSYCCLCCTHKHHGQLRKLSVVSLGCHLRAGAWSLEPLWDTNERARSTVSQERDPCHQLADPQEGRQSLLWVCGKGRGDEGTRGPACVKDTCTHTGTLFHRLVCTSTYPQALPPGTQTYRRVSGNMYGVCAYLHVLSCTHMHNCFTHMPPANAHTQGLTWAFVPSSYVLDTFIDPNPHSHMTGTLVDTNVCSYAHV